MLTPRQRIIYLIESAFRYWTSVRCPSCEGRNYKVLDRKYLITTLNECEECKLCFRHPTDSAEVNRAFYQEEYAEGDGITTFTPEPEDLKSLMNDGFSKFPTKNADRIKILFNDLFPGKANLKVVDYGASWGYISYQLVSCGFDVDSFEISKPRADFGNKHLQLHIHTDQDLIRNENEIFFSSHVIEHVPNPRATLGFARSKICKGGLVVTLCPNGSQAFREANPERFKSMWGKVHPNFLTEKFFKKIALDCPYYIASTPEGWSRISSWDKRSQVISPDLTGPEILFVWIPNP